MTLDISVLVPFKNHFALTAKCLQSLHDFGDPVREILLVSNNSSPTELGRVSALARRYGNVRVLEYDRPFNFQAINNFAAAQARGSVLMMLNNDVELVAASRGLLVAMHGLAMKEEVGAVGCVLLYQDRITIQHAGVYLVPGGTADHLYAGQRLGNVRRRVRAGRYSLDPFRDLRLTAVTAAAAMIDRRKFEQIGGMNERFVVCGGDVDLCLRLEEGGYQTWLVGADRGHMIHKESRSRSSLSIPYGDFYESYRIYVRHFDLQRGDQYLSWEEITNAS